MVYAKIGQNVFSLQIAQTENELEKGLMFRTSLKPLEGMLFIYPQAGKKSMWMKNTLIPLDMLFLDSTGKITKIYKSAQPHDLSVISSLNDCKYAIELNSGTIETFNIKLGQKVYFSI